MSWRIAHVLGSAVLVCSVVVVQPVRRCQAEERHVPSPNYPTVQSAIDACTDGDEVIIAAGTYGGAGNKDLDFGGRSITVRSTDPDDPNVVAATVVSAGGSGRVFYFHSGEDGNAFIAGLTITGGDVSKGGGIYCVDSSPTVTQCTISHNWASVGGGVACDGSNTATISHCTVSNNNAYQMGGGIACGDYTRITECVIKSNWAEVRGGGIYVDPYNNALIHDCQVIDNTVDQGNAVGSGGGISGYEMFWDLPGDTTISNCVIAGNSADVQLYDDFPAYGGGVADVRGTIRNCLIVGNHVYCSPTASGGTLTQGGGLCYILGTVINCTIAHNEATSLTYDDYMGPYPSGYGGGIYSGQTPDYGTPIEPNIVNCIITANTANAAGPDVYPVSYPTSHSFIGGDPRFVNIDGRDDDPGTWEDNNYRLRPNSPCVDQGDPSRDYSGQKDVYGGSRVVSDVVDIGADEQGCAQGVEAALPMMAMVMLAMVPLRRRR